MTDRLVLRVESNRGIGPYRGQYRDKVSELMEEQGNADRPLPFNILERIHIGQFLNDRYWVFGFSSPKQLWDWFGNIDLASIGLGIGLYTCHERVYEDKYQLAFDLRDSTRITWFPYPESFILLRVKTSFHTQKTEVKMGTRSSDIPCQNLVTLKLSPTSTT